MPQLSDSRQEPPRQRLRDADADPVHGQNPDYYAATRGVDGSAPPSIARPCPDMDPRDIASPTPDAFRPKVSGGPRPEDTFVREELHLEPYVPDDRPRSVPPQHRNAMIPRGRSRSQRRFSRDSSCSSSTISFTEADRRPSRSRRRRSPSPISRAQSMMADNFTNSTAGIGAGLIGAVVGGFVAKGASERAARRNNRDHDSRPNDSDGRAHLLTTIAGAVAGGLGANAVANRLQDARTRGRARQKMWETNFGPSDRLPHYDSARPADLNHRNGRGYLGSRGGFNRSDFEEYDYVYESRPPAGRRSRSDNYRRFP